MESSRKRNIRDGRQFDSAFPAPAGVDHVVKKEADVADTMALIQRALPGVVWQAKRIAPMLKGKTLEETCENIWRFVYNHIQYKRDRDGVEEVRSPRRTWHERARGVDCDCYTVFIGSILYCLRIPFIARVTKYPKLPPETPRWQHVYPIVPLDGRLRSNMKREDYITMDCVKDGFDEEQDYLDKKDFFMELQFLDGIDDEQENYDESQEDIIELMGLNTEEPENVDVADLAAVYTDEELGNIFKKIGQGIKKVTKKVADTTKKVVKKSIEVAKKGVRFVQRYVNPASILLRNGILLGMKLNMFNIGGRLRYAYLTDAQATSMDINLSSLAHVRKVKEKLENIYDKSGGKKENLKKAILSGKGNKDKKVPMNGLYGLNDVYADQDEYNIIHSTISGAEDLEGLGDLGIVAATAVAAATSALAAISAALKSVKGLFNKGGKQEASFSSDTDNATSETEVANTGANASQDEDALLTQSYADTAAPAGQQAQNIQPVPTSQGTPAATAQSQSMSYETDSSASDNDNDISPLPVLPASSSVTRRSDDSPAAASQSSALTPENASDQAQPGGFVSKATAWVKKNPVPTLLIAGSVIGGMVVAAKMMGGTKSKEGLSGLPKSKHKSKRQKRRKKHNKKSRSQEIKRIMI